MALPRIRFVARPAATLELPVKRNAGPAVETRLPRSLASSVRDALSVAFRAFGRVSGRKASSTTDLTPFGGYVEALSSHTPARVSQAARRLWFPRGGRCKRS